MDHPVSKGRKLPSVEIDTIRHCSVDRISNLPTELIGNILSFLPIKEAVATSVLSSRWKCFWTFITRLKANADSEPSFIWFMYRFLHRKTTTLDYLTIRCRNMSNIPHLRAWVSAALLVVGVRKLDLCIRVGNAARDVLPVELFSCKKLVKLVLGDDFNLDVPATVCLPSLKVLCLDYVGFRDEDSLNRLLSGCPSLKRLILVTMHLKALHIKALVLSNLTVIYQGDDGACGKMVLETPSLRYLDLDGVTADSIELTDLNQLVEAHTSDMHFSKGYKGVSSLIKRLSNVKILYICGSMMEGIVKSGCDLPQFHNLTTLKLGTYNDVGWALIPDLLEKSPFLETLVFDKGLKPHYNGRKVQESSVNSTWHAPQEVPYCLLHHLKLIQINHFHGDIEEEEMIQYFIENRGALKDLTVQYSRGSGKLWDIN